MDGPYCVAIVSTEAGQAFHRMVAGRGNDHGGPANAGLTHGCFVEFSSDMSEPATLALLGLGLLGFASARRRKR